MTQTLRTILKGLRELVQAALLATALFLVFHSVMEAREVQGPSMQPNFFTGERLIVNRLDFLQFGGLPFARLFPFGAPRRGDVIVFNPPVPSPDAYIKRIVGMPGDHVQIAGSKVYVDGQQLSEPYLHGARTGCGGRWCDIHLGANQYYVLGDNRGNSSDSRFWGPVASDRIVGSAWLVYFPFKDFGLPH